MKQYTYNVYFQIGGKKLMMKVKAFDEETAKSVVRQSIQFDKVDNEYARAMDFLEKIIGK